MSMIPVYVLTRYIPDVSIDEHIPMQIDFISTDLKVIKTLLEEKSDYRLNGYVVTFGYDSLYIDDSLCDSLDNVSLFYETLGDLNIEGISFMKYISPVYSYGDFLRKSDIVLSRNPDRHGLHHSYHSVPIINNKNT